MILKTCARRSSASWAGLQQRKLCVSPKGSSGQPELNLSWDISLGHFLQATFEQVTDAAGSSRPRASGAEHRVVLPETAARQGVTGHNVRYVLIVSTVAAIVALTVAYYFVFS